jgi:hypothetical protein
MGQGQQQVAPKTFSRASSRQRLTATIVFFAIVGTFAGLWLVAHYNITLYPFPCGFKQRFGLPCPTCGMTHAVIAFANGRIIDSFYTQPAAAFFCCLAVVAAFFAFIIAAFGLYSPAFERRFVSLKLRYIVAVLVFILTVGWTVTLAMAIVQYGSR